MQGMFGKGAMKRCLSMLLSLVMLLALTACGGNQAEASVENITEGILSWQEQFDLGVRYLSEGNYQEAIIAFTAAIEIEPKRVDAYLGLADVYTAMGDPDAAARVIEDAIAQLGELEELLARRRQERQADEAGFMTLLMRQEYRWVQDSVTLIQEYGVVTYSYDEYGYILSSEDAQYWYDDHLDEAVLNWTDYSEITCENGEMFEHCWGAAPDGRTEERGTESLGDAFPGSMIGTCTGITGWRGLCMDPFPGEDDAYWFCPSRVENDWMNSDTDWAYADVTYDDRGYPVSYTSYDSSGQVTGTAELYWETVPVLEE